MPFKTGWSVPDGTLRVRTAEGGMYSYPDVVVVCGAPEFQDNEFDVLLNPTGALLGYLLVGLWLGRAVHPRRRHWWHRFTKAG